MNTKDGRFIYTMMDPTSLLTGYKGKNGLRSIPHCGRRSPMDDQSSGGRLAAGTIAVAAAGGGGGLVFD
jgi:hypothetical protein